METEHRQPGTDDAGLSGEVRSLDSRTGTIYDSRVNSVHAQTRASIDLEGNMFKMKGNDLSQQAARGGRLAVAFEWLARATEAMISTVPDDGQKGWRVFRTL